MALKIRRRPGSKIEQQMAPMIDVVFQLLIFFMLTLKIVEPEGDFNINMPIAAAAQEKSTDINLIDLKVKLVADRATGHLAELRLGENSLGNGPEAWDRLRASIERIVLQLPQQQKSEQEVEIDADYDLQYQYIIRAVSACTGKMEGGELIRYVERIKFAPSERPAG